MKILVVEDDPATADVVKVGLMSDGHITEFARDGMEGSFLARNYEYEAIILDYSLPKKDGLAVCEEVRHAGKLTPIIFLSVTDDVPIKVAAFKRGADDYVTKPFSIEELRARLKAITRRPAHVQQPVFKVADLVLDADKQTVYRGNKLIRPTRKEYNLMQYMMSNAGIVLSRAMIMEHVWTADTDTLSNTVEAHIRNLRKKINEKDKPDLIAIVPGRGYVMDTPENLKKITGIK